jgi:hypothetical protein
MFEKKDKIIIAVGIFLTVAFFAVTVYFRSGAF